MSTGAKLVQYFRANTQLKKSEDSIGLNTPFPSLSTQVRHSARKRAYSTVPLMESTQGVARLTSSVLGSSSNYTDPESRQQTLTQPVHAACFGGWQTPGPPGMHPFLYVSSTRGSTAQLHCIRLRAALLLVARFFPQKVANGM